ncbi:calmodulin dependent protein kinase [Aaosphaeria arxii CBS 175.79]|uniref:Calmodulin dependent protein kinase n=1 Tax=Aaosphaeria arxii CBS 175.79 TaxID=1450172 RepID=A0A6A5XIW5_9PLEO|nr:calmodulin dependent protein kinase [Aaosphaeria arxii CBS 175.79]KAF2012710.1 calmodulin dependent protein kinase [Aaosphaeria arxii CBS 175.79]
MSVTESSPSIKDSINVDVPGIHSSNHISLDVPAIEETGRPAPVKFMSAPAYHSPLRHHKRAASSTRRVKETLNARSEYSNSEDDGTAQHRINQYLIKQEIGRGSFGAVHLAVDQYGQEYAVKEFSKSRLRKRAQSNLLRRPSARRRRHAGALGAGLGFNSPLHRHSSSDENNSLDLIKEEIAIMKKLNHPNLVSLIEVLDDPEEDSLYMVMEMCKKGVVMRVGLDERADPYDEEQCRCWFRDMILGIEYLHAQGIIHRDIKPDNCLVTADDVLKIVDFGVSEMFDKEGEMRTAKSAGSPAFMPPELCVPKHGHVSGKAADIWSMGVTLYCLLFGRIPFEKHGMIELYQSIRNDTLEFDIECGDKVRDLLSKLLDKDPSKRITMEALRAHPWVTRDGTDELLSTSENVAIIVEPPTDEEVNAAITGNMGHLVTVVRAVKRFKQLLFRKRPEKMEGILGGASRIVQPPLSIRPSGLRKSRSQDTDNRRPIETALTTEGIHREIKIDNNIHRVPESINEMASAKPGLRSEVVGSILPSKASITSSPISPKPVALTDAKVIHESMSFRPTPSQPIQIPFVSQSAPATPTIGKGHAHDPLEDTLFLNIGTGEDYLPSSGDDTPVVSESPGAVDIDVYETAYQEEINRIMEKRKQDGRPPTMYLTRRVENTTSLRDSDLIVDSGRTRDELKSNLKALGKRAKKGFDDRAELQRLEGKEDLLSRGWRNVREFKDMVDEAREIVREEERSRSSTPVGKASSRSGTPVAEKSRGLGL